MDIAGYIASILIGLSLGLIGGGGSILTVPVLVYLFSIDAVSATAYSLFIVGITSVVGSVSYFKKQLVDINTALVFGIPSIAAIFLTRHFLLPAIPQHMNLPAGITISKDILLLMIFAILMIVASYSMIKKRPQPASHIQPSNHTNYPLVLAQGIGVGVLTGLVGAGGGFLIIPALVNFLHLPIKKAIGTSLVIISINSFFGFVFSLNHLSIHWQILLSITAIAIIGILAGSYLSSKIDGKRLKPAFGWFVLVMGIYILVKESIQL